MKKLLLIINPCTGQKKANKLPVENIDIFASLFSCDFPFFSLSKKESCLPVKVSRILNWIFILILN